MFEQWIRHRELSFKELTLKQVPLLTAVLEQRCLDAAQPSCIRIVLRLNACFIESVLNHAWKGVHQSLLKILSFTQNTHLCAVSFIKEHLRRTKDMSSSGTTNLFVSLQKTSQA